MRPSPVVLLGQTLSGPLFRLARAQGDDVNLNGSTRYLPVMKFLPSTLLLAVVLATTAIPTHAATARRSQPPAAVVGKPAREADDDDKKDSTKPPFNGMTTAQALRFYGKPDSVGHRDGEELWTYVLNRGESFGKSFIPFNFNNKLRYRLLTFKNGKVVKFRWDAPDKE